MPHRFLLESIYSSAEYDPRYPASLRALWLLLDAVIDGPPPDPAMEALLRRLEEPQLTCRPTCH